MATITSVTQTANPDTERQVVGAVNGESSFDAIVSAVDQELNALRKINSAV